MLGDDLSRFTINYIWKAIYFSLLLFNKAGQCGLAKLSQSGSQGPWTINDSNDNNNTETENQTKSTSLTHHGEGG